MVKTLRTTPNDSNALDYERWFGEEITARAQELFKDASIGIPAKLVRARFEEKRRIQKTNAGRA